jgi:hypothetical protein
MNRHDLKKLRGAMTEGVWQEWVNDGWSDIRAPSLLPEHPVARVKHRGEGVRANALGIVAEHNCMGRVLELLERVRPSLVTLRGRLHDDRDYNGAASVAELLVAIDGGLEER